MVNRKAKEDEKDNEMILNKLETIEKQFTKEIKELKTSLNQIEESSGVATEDQLFFGITFTLLLVFLQLGEFDLAKVFEIFGITIEPINGFLTTRIVLILFLLFSSVSRYLTALTSKKTKNALRMASVSFLLGCFYYPIFDITFRGLSMFLINIHPLLIFLSPVPLIVISTTIGYFIEKKWVSHYGIKKAPAAMTFVFVGFSIAITYYLAAIVFSYIPFSEVVSLIITASSFLIAYLSLNFWLSIREDKKKEKVKK